jgi:hypothetical protein
MRNPDNLVRGRMIGAKSRRVIPFMYNPTELPSSHGWSHGRQGVPGRSHPVYGGGEGTAETFTVVLFLDGDRGRSDARARADGSRAASGPPVPIDVMPEVNALRSLVKPHDPNMDGAYGVPENVFVSMGTLLRAECSVHRVAPVITEMLPDLTALRATVTVDLEIVANSNQTTWLFLSSEPSNALTDQPELFPEGE